MKTLEKILQYFADTILDRMAKTDNEAEFEALYKLGIALNNFCVFTLYINLN